MWTKIRLKALWYLGPGATAQQSALCVDRPLANIAHSKGLTRLSITSCQLIVKKFHLIPTFPCQSRINSLLTFPFFSSTGGGSHMSPTKYGCRVSVILLCHDTWPGRYITPAMYLTRNFRSQATYCFRFRHTPKTRTR